MFKRILAVVLVIAALASFAVPVSAITNTSLAEAKSISLGKKYTTGWTNTTDFYSHYVKFTIPARGFIDIDALKPTDDNGNVGTLAFTLYDSGKNIIWDNCTYEACNDGYVNYLLQVGLAAGTYYLEIDPGFTVNSGTISTTFSVSFTKDSECEIEPNGSKDKATAIQLNQAYVGWFGDDGGYYEYYDYYKFNVTKGTTYRFVLSKYDSISDAEFKFTDSKGTLHFIDKDLKANVDSNGNHYYVFTAEKSGTAYVSMNGYIGEQKPYYFMVTNSHYYYDYVTYPTATAHGYTTRICVDCGYSYVANYTFPDVLSTSWYYNAVEFCVQKGYFSGYTSGKFGPADEITRQDFVVVLARISGVNLKKYSGRTEFKDVKAGSYYEAAIKWASSTGVVAGYKNGNFGVDDKLTREQLVTILYRYAKQKGCNMSVSNASMRKLNAFSDSGKISSYAKTACAWALQNGVLGGLNATTFGPQRNANRAQVAQILLNICNNKAIPF